MDVDHDGTTDVLALIKCQPGQGSFGRVVAFRPQPDGTFTTIGPVVQRDWSAGSDPNAIENVLSIAPAPDGQVRAVVGDVATSYTGGAQFISPWQERTYGWTGRAFVQTAGWTTFLVPPGAVTLAVAAAPMTYARAVDDIRVGTMTVTVRNAGATAVEDVSVLLATQPPAVCVPSGAGRYGECEIGHLDPGAAATVTFRHSIPDCRAASTCSRQASLTIRVGDQEYSGTPGVRFVFE